MVEKHHIALAPVVRRMRHHLPEEFRVAQGAAEMLRSACQSRLLGVMSNAKDYAVNSERRTVMPRDIKLAFAKYR
jgi:histone H3/H4